ncbi:MAG: hypothetical protein HW402_1132, partial [Dehalococcoidales bacterium]|nr:hypothetical protein [Dehalococcoidales bacterium]
LDDCLRIYYRGHYLDTAPAPAEATKMRELIGVIADSSGRIPRHVTKPLKDHPWRQWVYR